MDYITYRIEEGTLPFPDTWEDQSINVFVAPDASMGSSLTITRDTRVYGESEQEYLQRQLKDLAKALKNFSLVAEHEIQMAGEPAKAVEIKWRNEGELHIQLISFMFLEERIIIFTGSAVGVMTDAMRQHFLGIMQRFVPSEPSDDYA